MPACEEITNVEGATKLTYTKLRISDELYGSPIAPLSGVYE